MDRTLSAEKTQPHGCVAVSFDSIMSASECTKAVDGMSFNNTALRTNLLIGAGLVDQEKNSTVSELSIDVLSDQLQSTENTAIEIANPLLEDVTADSTYIAEAESVEDFLNSLL